MPRDLFEGPEISEPRPLWPHQAHALNEVRRSALAGFRRIVLQLPVGAGKTRLAAEIVRGALKKGKRVAFTVPYLNLIDQTIEAFEIEGIDAIGVMQGTHERTDRSQPVQVCSAQTLRRRKLPQADVVLVDECHLRHKAVAEWLSSPDAARMVFIGLSATPWARGMAGQYEHLIVGATMRELTECGRLSPFRIYAPDRPDLSQVRVQGGDYAEGDLSAVMQDRALVENAVSAWRRLGTRDKTLCFAVDRAHANALHVEFSEAGVEAAYVDAFTERDERQRIKRLFHEGKVQVVVSIGTLIAGIDWDIRTISWCRPTKSEMLWIQATGRGSRLAEGKEFCVLLDHAGTALSLGLPTDIHHGRLFAGKGDKSPAEAAGGKVALPKVCAACGVLKPAKTLICQACGFRAEKQSGVIVEEGELIEFGAKVERKEKFDLKAKQIWFSSLLAIADERGYKTGWAANKFREKMKVWPRGLSEARIEPSAEVRSWVRSRQIAFAKSKRRAA